MANDFLTDPYQVTIGSLEIRANKDITQIVIPIEEFDKQRELAQILRQKYEGGRILVFSETKRGCDQLTGALRRDGYNAKAIHGDKSQQERDWVLKEFRENKCNLMIATDVAARGLDIDDITLVVNYDMPNNIEDYVHRIGRTARAGKKGEAISFFTSKNAGMSRKLVEILNEAQQAVPPMLMNMMGHGGGRGGRGGGRGRGGGGYRGGGGKGGGWTGSNDTPLGR